MQDLQKTIEDAFERRAEITPRNVDPQVKDSVMAVIDLLDMGELRVAERTDGQNWITHQWVKKAVLLSFRLEDNQFIKGGYTNYYDKVPSKFADFNSKDFREGGFRVVPPAAVRKGSYIARNVVLMPSYVNIGAYVGEGTMVDTWATVGSCAQIGKNVHLSGGVGIGGVLEPPGSQPVIVEDGVFVGSRAVLVATLATTGTGGNSPEVLPTAAPWGYPEGLLGGATRGPLEAIPRWGRPRCRVPHSRRGEHGSALRSDRRSCRRRR